MPTRTASVKKKIAANGQLLHRAMMSRAGKEGAAPTEAETALLDERKQLKEEREKRKAQALLPRPSALDRLVRTHHPVAKAKAGKKDHHEGGEVKKPKARKSRAEKHTEKAAALEAARRSPKKPAK